MRYRILYNSRDLLRLELKRGALSGEEADVLYYALSERRDVIKTQVFVRTGQVCVRHRGTAEEILSFLDTLPLDQRANVKIPAVSARATNEHYKEVLIGMLLKRYTKRFFLPASIRAVFTVKDAIPFI